MIVVGVDVSFPLSLYISVDLRSQGRAFSKKSHWRAVLYVCMYVIHKRAREREEKNTLTEKNKQKRGMLLFLDEEENQ